MMRVYVQSVGVLAPGLPGWPATRAVLNGTAPYRAAAMPQPLPEILPPTERRRSSETARLAVAVAQEAMSGSGLAAEAVATVFASSDGDGQITHEICQALATPAQDVSPTRFHNSVYNAPAGYWSIATGSRLGSTSLCAYDASFAAGLLEAASQATVEALPVLLMAFDLPMPPPLHALRPVAQGFAAAFLLTPAPTDRSLARWDIELDAAGAQGPPTAMPALLPEGLRDNPAARCLPLLQALAGDGARAATVRVDYLDGRCLAVHCGVRSERRAA